MLLLLLLSVAVLLYHAGMLEDAFIHSDQQGLTEAFLAQEFGWTKEAPPPARGRETIAWFMDRQVCGGGAPVASAGGSCGWASSRSYCQGFSSLAAAA